MKHHHARDISQVNYDEGEVDFRPGTRFKVVERKQKHSVLTLELEERECGYRGLARNSSVA